jgi:hypothetical protein
MLSVSLNCIDRSLSFSFLLADGPIVFWETLLAFELAVAPLTVSNLFFAAAPGDRAVDTG